MKINIIPNGGLRHCYSNYTIEHVGVLLVS